jgi:hypothetical protein
VICLKRRCRVRRWARASPGHTGPRRGGRAGRTFPRSAACAWTRRPAPSWSASMRNRHPGENPDPPRDPRPAGPGRPAGVRVPPRHRLDHRRDERRRRRGCVQGNNSHAFTSFVAMLDQCTLPGIRPGIAWVLECRRGWPGSAICASRSTSVTTRSFRPDEVSESFVTVTLPFHPLAGRRLRVLGQQRSHRGLELDCVGGDLGRVRLPAAWTDRVPPETAGRGGAGDRAGPVAGRGCRFSDRC